MHRSLTHGPSGAVDSPSLLLPDREHLPTERPARDGPDIPRMPRRRNIWLIIARRRVSGAPGFNAAARDARCGADPAHGSWTPGLQTEQNVVQSTQGHC